ncbi:DUF3560 domain-containing protein [Streptomyces kronopolitis]|uniref:DUF3560 domain-containing protein n=1 Tax=Streptomyces kronopolitis TaxID=1612435 RepID=UPI0036B33173
MIEITHSHADGTLACTGRGDADGEILEAHGFRWMPSLGVYGISSSRDRVARRTVIARAAAALEQAGFSVTTQIDDTPRDPALVRQARHGSLEQRRAALTAKGESAARASQARRRRSDNLVEGLPLAQPVKPGKAGRGHRRRLDQSVDAATDAAHLAKEAQRQFDLVRASHQEEQRREAPDVTARRVARLEAEIRAIDRRLTIPNKFTGDLPSELLAEELRAQRELKKTELRGERARLEEAREEGRFGKWHQGTVEQGDLVCIRDVWRTVVRSNKKSVSVSSGYSWTDRYGYEEITELRRPGRPGNAEGPAS